MNPEIIYLIIIALVELFVGLVIYYIKRWKYQKHITILVFFALLVFGGLYFSKQNENQEMYTTEPSSYPTTIPPPETESPIPSVEIITVDDNRLECSDADYTCIQEAIDNANEGDTIKVYAGVYEENINIFKSLNLIGVGRPLLITKYRHSYIVTLSAGNCTLEGFDFCKVSVEYHGIYIKSDYNKVTNNYISSSDIGISIYNGTANHILGNRIHHSSVAISVRDSHDNTISDNNCYHSRRYGIDIIRSDNIHVENNTFSNSSDGSGIFLYESNNNIIRGNKCKFNDKRGIHIMKSTYNKLSKNCCENNNNGIAISNYSSENTILDNDCRYNISGVFIENSDNNYILNNILKYNTFGIYIYNGENTISGNIFGNNKEDIYKE